MKQTICFLCVAALLFGFAACADSGTNAPAEKTTDPKFTKPEVTEPKEPEIRKDHYFEVLWYEDLQDYPEENWVQLKDHNENCVPVAFLGENLYDFQLMTVTVEFQDDWDEPLYHMETVHEIDVFVNHTPLIIPLEFLGDLPQWAVSFTDAYGVSYRYLLYISGMDNSLLLEEIAFG